MLLRLGGLALLVWGTIVWFLLAGTEHDALQLLFSAVAICGLTMLTYYKGSFVTLCGAITTGITSAAALMSMGVYVMLGLAGFAILVLALFILAAWGLNGFRKALIR